jgi:hypothetical protein
VFFKTSNSRSPRQAWSQACFKQYWHTVPTDSVPGRVENQVI